MRYVLIVAFLSGCASIPEVEDFPSMNLTLVYQAAVKVKEACNNARAECCCINCKPGSIGRRVIHISHGAVHCLKHELCHAEHWDPEHKGPCRPDRQWMTLSQRREK